MKRTATLSMMSIFLSVLLVGLAAATAWAQAGGGGWKSGEDHSNDPPPQKKTGGWGNEPASTNDDDHPQHNGGWGVGSRERTPASSSEHGGDQRIYVVYGPTKSDFGRSMEQGLRSSHGFETLASNLDSRFRLPRDLPIVLTDCGVVNLFYDPQNHRIVVCYEFMEHLTKLARDEKLAFDSNAELGTWIGRVTVFGLFHEFGHALIGELELPSTGREEDAVDEFASITLSGVEGGPQYALAGAGWFKLEDNEKQKKGVSNPYWDEHSFDLQRMVTIVCILYGSDPAQFKSTADGIDIPPEREERCAMDFPRKQKAWATLLKPYLKRSL